MLQLDRILFPVDFSQRCSAAAPHVMTMARDFNAEVTMLHVLQMSPLWYGEFAPTELDMLDVQQLVRSRQTALDEYLCRELPQDAGVERVVEKGEPATVIADYARRNGTKLIMMPTHGYGPFRRLLMGSVTAKVLHDAECPVWTDVHEETSFARDSRHSVLCAVDLTEDSLPAIRWAAAFARSFHSELTIVHAIPALAGPAAPGETRFRAFISDHARSYIADLQEKAGTSARVCVGGGKIADAVRGAALQHEAELVVIGQGHLHETLGALRSNAYAIIRQSPCPVVRV
jgi:nucleotide-binding universal stress UspA family protein